MESVRAAQDVLRRDRRTGLAALNHIFRTGSQPTALLEGAYAGEMVAFDVAPGLTRLAEALNGAWGPWRGKIFDRKREGGVNIFRRSFLILSRVFWPLYRHARQMPEGRATAFRFRTYPAYGLADPDRRVLAIDYDLRENPALSVRRLRDEVVQIGDDCYLGKAHFHWWWGRRQTVIYFTLVR